ncbi:MAG TPA: flagellar hook capping FlgD N-terminal domain-containing protein [Acidocella sp.]|jgi:flagellar basal-body rod modification protein FlgD|nr:flagellar hook capping FlgD N-terminal domain-containing protein [Acidocella sp.]
MTSLAIPSANSVMSAASTTGTSGSTQSSSTGSGSAANLSQSDFLQLLTAQLQYQTPTNPADPTALAGEFAEISTVDGIDNLNTKVAALGAASTTSQLGLATSLVGKQVAMSGDGLITNANGSAEGAFSLAGAANNVTVTVMNSAGKDVGSMKLGALGAGQQTFNWTGGSANQQYTYEISATNSSGATVSTTPYTVFTVQSVNVSGSAPSLNVAGYDVPMPMSLVQTVLGGTSS